MKKTIFNIFIFFSCTIIASCFGGYSRTSFDFDPKIVFKNSDNEITLKQTKAAGDCFSDDIQRTFSYIIKINESCEDCLAVYLYLTDNDGFQISNKIFIGNIHENFTGTLKGNFSITMPESEKICGAELSYQTISD